MNKYYFQIITRFPYKPPRRNTGPSDITASSQLKINLSYNNKKYVMRSVAKIEKTNIRGIFSKNFDFCKKGL